MITEDNRHLVTTCLERLTQEAAAFSAYQLVISSLSSSQIEGPVHQEVRLWASISGSAFDEVFKKLAAHLGYTITEASK